MRDWGDGRRARGLLRDTEAGDWLEGGSKRNWLFEVKTRSRLNSKTSCKLRLDGDFKCVLDLAESVDEGYRGGDGGDGDLEQVECSAILLEYQRRQVHYR